MARLEERAAAPRRARSGRAAPTAVHDLLLRLGDLAREEIAARCASAGGGGQRRRRWSPSGARVPVRMRPGSGASWRSRTRRATATRWASPLPPGLPEALLGPRRPTPLGELVARYARTHGPFTAGDAGGALRRLAACRAEAVLERAGRGGPAAGGRLPAGRARARVVRPRGAAHPPPALAGPAARRRWSRSSRAALGRLLCTWHGVLRPRRAAWTRCSTRSSGCRGARSRPRCWSGDPAGARGGLPARATSTRWRRPARWCGWASSPWASATAALRSTSTDALPRLLPPGRRRPRPRRSPTASAPSWRTCGGAGASFFADPPRGRGRRLPAADRGRALEPRLERPRHQRHLPRAARLHGRPPVRAAGPAQRSGPSRPTAAAGRRRPRRRGAGRSCPSASPSPTEWSMAEAQQLLAGTAS